MPEFEHPFVECRKSQLAGPVPTALDAATVNVYDTVEVNPDTVIGEDAAVPVSPPGVDVAR